MGMLGMWTGARHEEEDPIGQYLGYSQRVLCLFSCLLGWYRARGDMAVARQLACRCTSPRKYARTSVVPSGDYY